MKKFIQSFLFLLVFCVTPNLFAWDVNATNDATDASPGDGTCADSSGYCTLRAAIQEANASVGDQTIILPANTYTLTILGTDNLAAIGDLDITNNITIQGEGSDSTFINASGLGGDRIFEIPLLSSGLEFILQGVTLQDGGSFTLSNGGAIHVSSFNTLSVNDVTFTSNETEGDGGAIYLLDSTAQITSSTFTSNEAANHGGAIYLENSTAQVSSSTFTSNEANAGGAIYQEGGSLTIFESSFSQNNGGEAGGALYVGNVLEFNMSYSDLTGNMAAMGGGIVFFMNSSGVEIAYSTISENLAAMGGAIASAYTSPLRIAHSSLSGNQSIVASSGGETDCTDTVDNDGDGSRDFADSDCWQGIGGAIADFGQISGGSLVGGSNNYQLINTTLSGNTAASFGGAIFLATASTFKTYNTTIAENSAVYGGGVYNLDTPLVTPSTTELYNTILAANHASSLGDDCMGEVTSGGYSLIGDQLDCGFISATGDQVGDSSGSGAIDPLLGPMTNNGGETDTHALTTGSTAIDGGNPSGCLDESGSILIVDQRDELRPTDGNGDSVDQCDIGAYEAVAIDPVETPEDPEDPEDPTDEEDPEEEDDDDDCGCSSCCGCSGDITVTATASVGDTIINISYTGSTTTGETDVDVEPIPDEEGDPEEDETGIAALTEDPWGAEMVGGGCSLNGAMGMNVAQGIQLLFWALFMGIPVWLRKKVVR